jgi:hypothetical protein
MEKQYNLKVQFDQQDIISAHRMRYLHSSRLRLLAGIGLLALMYLLLQNFFPGRLPGGEDPTLAIGVAVIALGTPILAFLIAPIYDARTNSIWKQQFTVLANSERITVRQAGQPAGYAMTWKSLSRVLENSRVLVFIFGRETNFLILPKSALGRAERVEDFKKFILRSRAALKKENLRG